jgi:WD40 repeat protein
MTFSPDDTLLASGGLDGGVILWDAYTGSLQDLVAGHGDRVWCTAFAPDGKRLATAGRDGAVKLWDVRGRDDRRVIQVVGACDGVSVDWAAFAPDGKTLLTWSNINELRRWHVLSGRRAEPSGEPTTSLRRPALAPNGRLITVAGDGRNLHMSDLAGGAAQVYRHVRAISTVAISPDGKRVAFADDSPALWLWEVGLSRPMELGRPSGVCGCLAFAPDGGTVAAGDSSHVLLLNAVHGRLSTVWTGHQKEITSAVAVGGRFEPTNGIGSSLRCLWMLGVRT